MGLILDTRRSNWSDSHQSLFVAPVSVRREVYIVKGRPNRVGQSLGGNKGIRLGSLYILPKIDVQVMIHKQS